MLTQLVESDLCFQVPQVCGNGSARAGSRHGLWQGRPWCDRLSRVIAASQLLSFSTGKSPVKPSSEPPRVPWSSVGLSQAGMLAGLAWLLVISATAACGIAVVVTR